MNKDITNIDYLSSQYEISLKDCDDRTRKLLFAQFYQQYQSLFLGLECCESPIEKMMLVALEAYSENFNNISDGYFSINPQEEIEYDEKEYRVDISLAIILKGKEVKIAIECDGHEFHEKTKKQAANDKQRERALTKYGFVVMRFAGSEIWNNPYRCAGEILQYVMNY